MNLRKKLATPIIREMKGDCKMDKEKLMKMINEMVGSSEANPADEPVSIVYKWGQDENYRLIVEMSGSRAGIFAAICEITSIWSLGFEPEEREKQIRSIVGACTLALKDEEYVSALKRYLKIT